MSADDLDAVLQPLVQGLGQTTEDPDVEVDPPAVAVDLDAQSLVCAPWSKHRGIALGILTADCAPVLFADPQAGVIGAAHAGWRGAFTGVLEETVA